MPQVLIYTDDEFLKTVIDQNDTEIREYLEKQIDNPEITAQYLQIIEDDYILSNLTTRPLLLEMIITTISILKENTSNLNISTLYREYTNIWIENDDERSQLNSQGKKIFLWNLANKMFELGEDLSLPYTELIPPMPEHLKEDYQENKDYYKNAVTDCKFLNCDDNGNYKFIHKSFLDYFIAETFYVQLKENNILSIKYSALNEESKFFLKYIIANNKQRLDNLNFTNFDLTKIDLSNANLINTDLTHSNLKFADLSNANLRDSNLKSADLSNANLRDSNLKSADLSNTNLRYAKLSNTNLRYAKLDNADLRDTKLDNADLIKTSLSNAQLRYANLRSANLSDALNLTFAQIKSAYFWDQALYKRYWDKKQQKWLLDEKANQKYIEQIRQDKASDSNS